MFKIKTINNISNKQIKKQLRLFKVIIILNTKMVYFYMFLMINIREFNLICLNHLFKQKFSYKEH